MKYGKYIAIVMRWSEGHDVPAEMFSTNDWFDLCVWVKGKVSDGHRVDIQKPEVIKEKL